MIRRRMLLSIGVVAALVVACSRGDKEGKAGDKKTLPALQFNGTTENLMLTWIDARGDTHVEAKLERVPKEQSQFVRVLIGDSEHGASDPIYVADISEPSDMYTARTIPRSEWEDEIERRRKNPGEVAANERPKPKTETREPRAERPEPSPGEKANPRPSANPDDSPPAKPDPVLAGVDIVVYGAAWCSACHQAVKYIRGRGAKVTFKNIETDKGANAEMLSKLDRVKARSGSIPVIDIGGQILVGFSARDIDRALRKVGRGKLM